jgi:myo-inositol 2-dehydrogenase/D-chiro-inositol 1-dehydrogenase
MAATPLRFGLAGYGPWGKQHAAAIAATPGACLVAVADALPPCRAAIGQAHPRAVVLSDWRQLLTRDDLDLIDVALPSPMHFDVAKAAIESGRHVLVAAPLVAAFRQADELVARACERQVMLAVDHHRRLAPLWSQVKAIVDRGLIGLPQRVLWEAARAPGGWVCTEWLHGFDLARWYLSGRGEPVTLCVRTNSSELEHCTGWSAVVDFAGSDCPCAPPPASAEPHATCTVHGPQGTIRAMWRAAEPASIDLRYGTPECTERVRIVEPTGEAVTLSRCMAALVQSIRAGTPPTASGVDGRMAVRMTQAAKESLRRGTPVRIREVE